MSNRNITDEPQNIRTETLKTVKVTATYEIKRWVSSYAYARNGNTHNPTPYYMYERWENGKMVDYYHKYKPLCY